MTDINMESSSKRNRLKEFIAYLIALLLCSLIVGKLFHLRHADLSVPFIYDGGDAVFYSMVIKAIITNGWYLSNSYLGMPFGMNLHDFPMPDNLHFLVIKIMGLFTSNFARILNLFYLFTFPLTTLCSLYVLRRFGISYGPSILASLLYSFTWFHLSRSEHHLMYSAYYPVPLMVMVLLWVCSEELSFTRLGDLRNPKLICSLLICILISSTGGAYYSFFALFLLLSAGLFVAIRRRSIRKLILPGLLIAMTFGTFLANLTPNIIYRLKHDQASTAQRIPGEAEIYGMKISQLLLPIDNHRLSTFAKFKERYNKSPLVNENTDSALGIIGSIGFLTLIGWLLYRKSRIENDRTSALLDHLSLLNATAILLGTIGGFGSLFAHFVSPQIRGYNRISVYIAFFSFFTVALLLDRLWLNYFQTRTRQAAFYVLILLLIVIGILDQSPKRLLPDFALVNSEFRTDREFVRRIESSLPSHAMIFQLPIYQFPEGETYNHFKGYLHSNRLRWSFGAMRDRDTEKWQKGVAMTGSADRMIETLAMAGFSGIYIDRHGYSDNGIKIESEISRLVNTKPLVSSNKRLSFFNIEPYRQMLEGKSSSEEWNLHKEKALFPLLLSWRKDFYDMEGTLEDNWRWCMSQGELQVENTLPKSRRVTLEMAVSSLKEGTLKIQSQFFNESLPVNPTETQVSKTILLPPGQHSIRFVCDAPAVSPSPDPRQLVFRVNNLTLKDMN